VDCDLKEFWIITNENIWGHREHKVYDQIVAHYKSFSKRRAQLAIVSEPPTIVLAQLALLLNSY